MFSLYKTPLLASVEYCVTGYVVLGLDILLFDILLFICRRVDYLVRFFWVVYDAPFLPLFVYVS